MSQITCKNLVLGYNSSIVTRDINFSVSKGDYLCIVGENGSGKSTLIKALLSLIKPLDGSVEISHKGIGYLPQQTEIQKDFPASVREVVLSGCASSKKGIFYGKREKAIAKSNMEKLGICDLSKKSFLDLSGGQQQRVFLARALCAASDILLLDEPVAGLDPKITNEMYEIVYSLNQNDGMTIIMVSHDIAAALKYATHILHIGEAQLFFGTKKDYLASEIGKTFVKRGND